MAVAQQFETDSSSGHPTKSDASNGLPDSADPDQTCKVSAVGSPLPPTSLPGSSSSTPKPASTSEFVELGELDVSSWFELFCYCIVFSTGKFMNGYFPRNTELNEINLDFTACFFP